MTYIWNRVEKVPANLMPERVEECFADWLKEEESRLALLKGAKDRANAVARIKRQTKQFETAIAPFKA